MSEPTPIRQSEEGIDLRKILVMGIGSLLLGLVGVLVVYWVLSARGLIGGEEPRRPSGRAGLILRNLLEAPQHRPGPEVSKALEGYGWVDRDRGIARIPIERAMTIVAERGR